MIAEAPAARTDEALTAAQCAYARVKEMIVRLELAPGATINESELGSAIATGRTPLREALHRLASEGMLHIYPRRAIVVATLGLSEVREVFEVRLALESSTAELAAQRCTLVELDRVVALGAELRAAHEAGDVARFLKADQLFHRTLAAYARNPFLARYTEHVLTLNLWLWNMYFAARGSHRTDLFVHEAIIAALEARDGPGAEAAMRDHIRSSKEQLLAGL